jgi:hypothetical protein
MNGLRLAALALTLALVSQLGAQGPAPAPAPAAAAGDKQIVALVNGVPITRAELADELIQRKGKTHLDALINRKVIEQACAKAGITVTEKDVEDELREIMRGAGITTASEFESRMVKPMLRLTLMEYKEDVLRPGILTRRLAANRIQVSEDELKKAFEAKYGPRVQCRIILERNWSAIKDMHAKIAGDRQNFIQLARQQSDRDLAMVAGQIPPIGQGSSGDDVEKRAFEMRDGEVSEVLQPAQGAYAILLREYAVPPDTSRVFEQERDALLREVTERKTSQEVPKLVEELKRTAKVENYLQDQYAGVKELLEKMDREFRK